VSPTALTHENRLLQIQEIFHIFVQENASIFVNLFHPTEELMTPLYFKCFHSRPEASNTVNPCPTHVCLYTQKQLLAKRRKSEITVFETCSGSVNTNASSSLHHHHHHS
jgi:hypothetical protein